MLQSSCDLFCSLQEEEENESSMPTVSGPMAPPPCGWLRSSSLSLQDGELFATVQGILKGADLQSITTNSVCKQVHDGSVCAHMVLHVVLFTVQVFAKYPSLDLSERKDYLKNCIDKVLAAS